MSNRQRMADGQVDAFVAAVNASHKLPLSCDSIPEPCRLVETDGFCDWRIVPSQGASWIPELEGQLPFGWPLTFRSLISRYLFPSFECGPLQFYSVGVTDPIQEVSELRTAVLRDRPLLAVLWKNGYLPFARPEDGSYDPVCFDRRKKADSTEPAIVRIDHEEILCRDRLRIKQIVSPSFGSLLEEMTSRLSSRYP
jgi:hypothetical protein